MDDRFKEMIRESKKVVEHEVEFKNEIFFVSLLSKVLGKSNFEKTVVEKDNSLLPLTKKKLSIKEFIIDKKPKSDVQKVLIMGFFLEQYENYESFNVNDIKDMFVKAKESIPDNVHDKINMNIKKGLITEYPEGKNGKKAFHLTSTGENLINIGWGDSD